MFKGFILVIFLHSLLATVGFSQDLDEDIQGDPTTVTRYNSCVEEKLKSFNPINGTIPLVAGSLPSSDLVCDGDECGAGLKKGDRLTPTEAKLYFDKRFVETRCQWTLADLDPAEDKNIWTNHLSQKLNPSLDIIEVENMDKVYFASQAWGRLGSYRITVNKYNEFGTPIQYSMILSKTIHNYILRKSLLRKLGYKIPPSKWLKTVKVKFDNKDEVKDFISKLSINNAGSFDRWVLNKTNNNEVILQDVVLMEDQEFDLNLSKGYISAEIAEGKRIYDSLLIPFALVEVPESINMFDWTFGREYSNNLVVKYPISREFQTSYHDALWISRRIMKLSSEDWWEIVESTNLPASVKLLLFEKLKARRNHLAQLLGIDNIELPVDTAISNQDDLVDGEIVKEFYDGYARRFKMPDPESPLSGTQMTSFFKSKALTIGLNLLGQTLNSQKFMGTDIAGNIDKKVSEILAENVATSAATGEVTKTPLDTFIFPTVKGSLVLNREIIAGGYLGTDNRLQLVDTVGGVVGAGLFGGVTGIYSHTGKIVNTAAGIVRQKVPVNISANAQINLSRMYSHIRPIMSIEQGLKYKFKNIVVPNLLKNYGNVFNQLLTDEFQSVFNADSDKGTAKMMEMLNENIEVGESVIITDSIDTSIDTNLGASLYQVVKLRVSVKPKKLLLSRLHILRKSEDEFHIYKSLGNANSVELSASLENFIPITKITFKMTKGKARTKYYRVMIGSKNIEGEDNYNRNDKIKALGSVFSSGSLSSMDSVQKPYVLMHKFKEDSKKFGVFIWRWNWLDQNDEIDIFSPEGQEINLFRRMEGKSRGRDYESYVKDVVKTLAGELLNSNFGFNSFNAGNPGNTFYGKAQNLISTYEGIKTKDGKIVKPFIKLSRFYNGWKMSRDRALDKLADIRRRYAHEFFKPDVLAQTDELFLYNISINFFLHTRGIDHLLSQETSKIERTWKNYAMEKNSNNKLKKLLNSIKSYKTYSEAKNFEKIAQMGVKIFRLAEDNLSLDGIMSLFGGGRNLMAIGKIDGFRIGDENGDESIISSSVGREGSESIDGPIGTIKKFLGMTDGEFYINWLLGRII